MRRAFAGLSLGLRISRRCFGPRLGCLLAFLGALPSAQPAGLFGRKSAPSLARQPDLASVPERQAKIEFRGARSFSEKELLAPLSEEIADLKAGGLSPARADDTAFYLGAFYRKKGFARATVDYQIQGDRLVLIINEGARTLLSGINFAGQHAFPEPTLWEYFLGATPEQLAKTPETFPFNEAEMAAGADRVRGLYLSEGYLDATVDASRVVRSGDETRARVEVVIAEGQRYVFDDVQFAGPSLFSKEELLGAMSEPIHGPYSAAKAASAQRNLQSYFKAHGYYQAEVTVMSEPTQAREGRVPILFTIQPGPLFRFGEVTVTGTERLRKDFLPKRFAHLQGQTYDPAKLDESFREMLRTGLFKNLRITPVPVAEYTLRLEMTVEEAKAREVGVTLGAGSYEGASLGLRLADRNLLGNGRPLTLGIDYSQRGLRGDLLYVDPWLFDTRVTLRARLFSEARDEEGYSKSAVGWRFDLARRLKPHLEAAAFLEQETVTLTANGIDPQFLGPADYFLNSVGLTSVVDYRDDPLNPSRGLILTNGIDFSTIDGEPAFTRFSARFSYYRPMGKALLALGARAGLIAPMGDRARLPIDVRYFNGGGTTVRSFAERQLGPKDSSGDPIGGEFYSVLNAELTYPLFKGLQGALFVDAGNLTSSSQVGFTDLRSAIGVGLRYKLPIGPLRLDYGLNPAPRAGEDRGAFHFSFGLAF